MIMFLIAMSDNVRGVFVPSFKTDFLVTDTQIGILLTVCSLGYVIFTYIGGILCQKIGQKKVMLLGFTFAALSLIGLYLSKSFAALLVGLFFLNVGVSLLAIGINTLISVLIVSYQAVLMNLIHFCYGVGATFTQRTAGIALFRGIAWRNIYLIIAGFFIIVLVGFLFIRIPEPTISGKNEKIDYKGIFTDKILYFYMIALGLYVSAELATGNWFVNFMREVYQYDENRSTFYLALFFGIFTIGRLLGGFVVERFGHIKTVLVSLIIGAILYTTGLILKEEGIVIISIAGLFFSIAFPTVVVTVNKVFVKSSAYITGIIITAASAISMIVNFLLGWFNDLFGIYQAFYIIPVSLFISIVFIYLIHINTREALKKS